MKKVDNLGFTLVELLAVIVILASVSLIVIGGISSSLNKREDKELTEQQELAISAAKIYFSQKTNRCVLISELKAGNNPYIISNSKTNLLKDNDCVKIKSDNTGYDYQVNCTC